MQSFPPEASDLWHSIMTNINDLEQLDWFTVKSKLFTARAVIQATDIPGNS